MTRRLAFAGAASLALLASGATGGRWAGASPSTGGRESEMDTAALAGRLTGAGYEALFLRLDTKELDAIWGEPGAPQALEALALDQGAPPEARFLAAEVLQHQGRAVSDPQGRAGLATAYAAALKGATLGNPWALPGEVDGPAGEHLVDLGEPAVPALAPLLDDQRRVPYAGSEEATIGNSYAYRVKDLAAFFISRIRSLPYTPNEDPAARDAEIERLRAAL